MVAYPNTRIPVQHGTPQSTMDPMGRVPKHNQQNRVHHVLLVAQGVAKDDTQTIMDGKLVFAPRFKRDAIFWMVMS